ncbi:MAG: hypothetical protein JW955_18415 [Sedimentisphaerales bacterium]|nr:hypothetical protein [Sedimentisphaerales bacterium]
MRNLRTAYMVIALFCTFECLHENAGAWIFQEDFTHLDDGKLGHEFATDFHLRFRLPNAEDKVAQAMATYTNEKGELVMAEGAPKYTDIGGGRYQDVSIDWQFKAPIPRGTSISVLVTSKSGETQTKLQPDELYWTYEDGSRGASLLSGIPRFTKIDVTVNIYKKADGGNATTIDTAKSILEQASRILKQAVIILNVVKVNEGKTHGNNQDGKFTDEEAVEVIKEGSKEVDGGKKGMKVAFAVEPCQGSPGASLPPNPAIIVQDRGDDLQSAQTVAHEIYHALNLGKDHVIDVKKDGTEIKANEQGHAKNEAGPTGRGNIMAPSNWREGWNGRDSGGVSITPRQIIKIMMDGFLAKWGTLVEKENEGALGEQKNQQKGATQDAKGDPAKGAGEEKKAKSQADVNDSDEMPGYLDLGLITIHSDEADPVLHGLITLDGLFPQGVAFRSTYELTWDTDPNRSGDEQLVRMTVTDGSVSMPTIQGEVYDLATGTLAGFLNNMAIEDGIMALDIDGPPIVVEQQIEFHVPKWLLSLDGVTPSSIPITVTSYDDGDRLADQAQLEFELDWWRRQPKLTLFQGAATVGAVLDFQVTGLTPESPFDLRIDQTTVSSGMTDPTGAATGQFVFQPVASLDDSFYFISAVDCEGLCAFNAIEMASLVIDDFESYTNESPNRVSETWIDGLGQYWPERVVGNDSGSVASLTWSGGGNAPGETDVVHGGNQSMGISYNNLFEPNSYVERTFDPPIDCNEYNTLSLWLRGETTNTGGQFFVAINDRKTYPVVDLMRPEWQEVTLSRWDWDPPQDWLHIDILSISIGVDDPGVMGMVYIDDIRLTYKPVVPKPPVARDVSVAGTANTPVTVTLQAVDDGLPEPPGALTYTVRSLPSHGSLADPSTGVTIGPAPAIIPSATGQVVYRPDPNWSGQDSFTFDANDGGVPPTGGSSNTATVSITIVGEKTVECQVSAGADDTHVMKFSAYQNTATPETVVGNYTDGSRFRNVQIPQGATIKSATWSWCSYTYGLTGRIEGRVQAEAADNPADFTGVTRRLSVLKLTSASQTWNFDGTPWTANTWYDSPDISRVIQEVVNRPGWSSGNSLVLIYSTSDSTEDRRIWAFDGDPTKAPRLKITYQPK